MVSGSNFGQVSPPGQLSVRRMRGFIWSCRSDDTFYCRLTRFIILTQLIQIAVIGYLIYGIQPC